ncbi:unnamed protein product [Paramecium pentaurelia]|uniref:Uncharacterized protein n=1 Tax=Paramecium pentaurelia TaxID=43138 RepID=A0A8S1YH77_9CILI|nr:unnamed protein product [Paramecium pentaurelia]
MQKFKMIGLMLSQKKDIYSQKQEKKESKITKNEVDQFSNINLTLYTNVEILQKTLIYKKESESLTSHFFAQEIRIKGDDCQEVIAQKQKVTCSKKM